MAHWDIRVHCYRKRGNGDTLRALGKGDSSILGCGDAEREG